VKSEEECSEWNDKQWTRPKVEIKHEEVQVCFVYMYGVLLLNFPSSELYVFICFSCKTQFVHLGHPH